jgi:hypothetical protein
MYPGCHFDFDMLESDISGGVQRLRLVHSISTHTYGEVTHQFYLAVLGAYPSLGWLCYLPGVSRADNSELAE